MSPRLAPAYFALQGVLVLAWWLMLVLWPGTRRVFTAHDSLAAFALPDVLMVGIGSLMVALVGSHRWPMTSPLAWLVAGATIYAALYTLNASLLTGRAWLAPVLMLPAAALSLLAVRTMTARAMHP